MQNIKVTYNKKEIELDIMHGTEEPSCVDISKFEKELKLFTFDPAFVSTASCESKITFIDGDKGVLAHRGHLIEDLAGNLTLLELFFLLMTGKKKEEDMDAFDPFKKITIDNLKIDNSTVKIISSFKQTDHPMGILMAAFSNIAAKNSTDWNPSDIKSVHNNLLKLVGEFLACVIVIYRFIKGKSLEIKLTPHFTESICFNMFDDPEFKSHKKEVEDVINRLLVLHADHEQNASTSTVRMVASTEVNPYASIVSGVAALWGPLHGGANESVVKMLDDIRSVEEIPAYLERVKNKEVKLMGFGHRVYKNYDPRAKVIKKSCDAILDAFSASGKEYDKLKIARELEKQAMADEYFTSRKLFPNVDFYSGIIYKALDIPTNFFTVMFAAARVTGWCAQMYEFYSGPRKISRPRQLYTGEKVKKG
ncbi:MAG: citrate synthase [Candidatus Deianiraeaceae bacterium]|jgi:citrate synthase